MALRRLCSFLAILCLCSGCGKKVRPWVVSKKIKVGPISSAGLSREFDLRLSSDGSIVIPYILIWDRPRVDTRDPARYTAPVAVLAKEGERRYTDIIDALEPQNSGDLVLAHNCR